MLKNWIQISKISCGSMLSFADDHFDPVLELSATSNSSYRANDKDALPHPPVAPLSPAPAGGAGAPLSASSLLLPRRGEGLRAMWPPVGRRGGVRKLQAV